MWYVQRTERSFTELTQATLKVNTRINFTLSFAPTLTTKLIFVFDNLELIDWKFSLQWYLSTSYFGIMERFNLKLLPEFDGSPTGPSVVEWFEKAKRICWLCKIKEPVLAHKGSLHRIPVTRGWCKPGRNQAGTVCGFWCRPVRHLETVYQAMAWAGWDGGRLLGWFEEAGCAVWWHDWLHIRMRLSGRSPGWHQSATARMSLGWMNCWPEPGTS